MGGGVMKIDHDFFLVNKIWQTFNTLLSHQKVFGYSQCLSYLKKSEDLLG